MRNFPVSTMCPFIQPRSQGWSRNWQPGSMFHVKHASRLATRPYIGRLTTMFLTATYNPADIASSTYACPGRKPTGPCAKNSRRSPMEWTSCPDKKTISIKTRVIATVRCSVLTPSCNCNCNCQCKERRKGSSSQGDH